MSLYIVIVCMVYLCIGTVYKTVSLTMWVLNINQRGKITSQIINSLCTKNEQ